MAEDTKKEREKEKEKIREELRTANCLVRAELKLIRERLKKGVDNPRVEIEFGNMARQLERDKLIIKTLYFLLDLDVWIPLKMYESLLGKEKEEGD